MKSFTIALSLLLSFSSLANTYQQNHTCEMTQGEDIGTLSIYGDPTTDIYTSVSIDGDLKAFKYGTTDRGYMYLYDDSVNGTKSYALEIDNFPSSKDQFLVYIYKKNHQVLGSLKISEYTCVRESFSW